MARIRRGSVPDGGRNEILFRFSYYAGQNCTDPIQIYLRHKVDRAMTPGSNPGRRTTGNGSENHPTERTGHPAPDHDPVVRGGLVWQHTLRTSTYMYDFDMLSSETAQVTGRV